MEPPDLFGGSFSLEAVTGMGWDPNCPWYHGSPRRLTALRVGSSITQDRDLARVFSHKPSLVSWGVDANGRATIRHSGAQPGYLYQLDETVTDEDIRPHPQTAMAPGSEWLTRRALKVRLLGPTEVRADEVLTPAAIAALMRRKGSASPSP